MVLRVLTSRASHVVQHVKHPVARREGVVSIVSRSAWTYDEKWKPVLGSNDATTAGWNQQHGRSTVISRVPSVDFADLTKDCSECHLLKHAFDPQHQSERIAKVASL